MKWYFHNLEWNTGEEAGETTWLEIALDFQFATGIKLEDHILGSKGHLNFPELVRLFAYAVRSFETASASKILPSKAITSHSLEKFGFAALGGLKATLCPRQSPAVFDQLPRYANNFEDDISHHKLFAFPSISCRPLWSGPVD